MQSVLGLAGKLAGELISPVFKQYIAKPWLHGSQDEFEKVEKTMSAMEAVLLDAEERQQTNNQIQHWLREIKILFYDVEDLLQEVTTEALKRQAKKRNRNWKNKVLLHPLSCANTSTFRLKMGSKVKSIRERLDAISMDSKRFNFTERRIDESRSKTRDRDETHSLVRVENFIGRDTEKKHVTKLLVESDVAQNVSVVSIIGIGGMGKTTLAQSIYNSDEVRSKFDLRMWVCISDPFDVKLICENIIMSVTNTTCDRLSMEVVKNKLESCIHGRKYLLVLDDVWNEKQMEWDKLEVLLAGGARGSKILSLLGLRMGYFWLMSVPQFVGGLRHLYYLDLSGNQFDSLPELICSLYNLQTLVLSECTMLIELPAGTRDLRSLRRLDITGCRSLRYMPRGLEELTCLQTLNDFVCAEEGGQRGNYAEVCELKSLINLKGSLEIRNLRGGSLANAKCERKRSCILVELKLITELDLGSKGSQYKEELKEEEEEAELLLIESLKPHPNLEKLTIQCYQGKKFPSWMDRDHIGISLPNIAYIDLYDCCSLRHVAALGLLLCLQKLVLRVMKGMEYLIDSESTLEEPVLFPSLKELSFYIMFKLEGLVEPTESSGSKKRYFPVLEQLTIQDCPLFLADGRNEDGKQLVSLLEVFFQCSDIETLPSGLQYVPHLQTLEIVFCNRLVSLPEWIGDLTSLQQLRLRCLYSLASIPDCMQRLTSLQRLQIHHCGELESRCKKETGDDWHKIAHIPNIDVS